MSGRRRAVPILFALPLLAFGVGAAAPGARAARLQERGVVRGVIRDEGQRALAGAQVVVVGRSTTVETDEEGSFTIARLPAGPALLVARRIGFAPETVRVEVVAATPLTLPLTLRRVVMALDTVLVRGRADVRGPLAGFYARRDRGHGHFFTAEEIDRRNIRRMSDLLRGVPGMRIDPRRSGGSSFRMRGSTVAPLVWLDGAPMGAGEVDLDNFDPKTFAAIEIYNGPATVPAEFSGGQRMTTSGGTIVLWTRQGEVSAARRRSGVSPTMVIIGMLDRGEVFTAAQVEEPARPIGAGLPLPLYPDSLFTARGAGRVEVQFVVGPSGRVQMNTFGVVATTHRQLGDAVRRSLEGAVYVPATRAGRPVAQLVLLPYEFLPDSGVVARKPKD